jgi:hypothetical protein
MNDASRVHYDFIPQLGAMAGGLLHNDPNSDFIMALGARWPTKPQVIGRAPAGRRTRPHSWHGHLWLGTRFRRQSRTPKARPFELRGLTAQRGQAKGLSYQEWGRRALEAHTTHPHAVLGESSVGGLLRDGS